MTLEVGVETKMSKLQQNSASRCIIDKCPGYKGTLLDGVKIDKCPGYNRSLLDGVQLIKCPGYNRTLLASVKIGKYPGYNRNLLAGVKLINVQTTTELC